MVGARQQSKKGMRPGQKSRDQQPSEITKSFKQIKTHRQHKSPQTFWKLYGAAAASEPEPPRPPPAAPERAGPRRSPGQRPGPARPAEPPPLRDRPALTLRHPAQSQDVLGPDGLQRQQLGLGPGLPWRSIG